MADPYRKTQPGERLQISSRAWNRVLDGNHRANVPVGQGFALPTLPSIRGMMQWAVGAFPSSPLPRPVFGQVWEMVAEAGSYGGEENPSGELAVPEVPIPEVWEPQEIESNLFRYTAPPGLPVTASLTGRNMAPFAICVAPDRMEFVFAGFAWTRVRMFAASHQYARLPGRFEDTDEQKTEVRGCLDSCFFGPARIVGYLSNDTARPHIIYIQDLSFIDFPSYQFAWALVKF